MEVSSPEAHLHAFDRHAHLFMHPLHCTFVSVMSRDAEKRQKIVQDSNGQGNNTNARTRTRTHAVLVKLRTYGVQYQLHTPHHPHHTTTHTNTTHA